MNDATKSEVEACRRSQSISFDVTFGRGAISSRKCGVIDHSSLSLALSSPKTHSYSIEQHQHLELQ